MLKSIQESSSKHVSLADGRSSDILCEGSVSFPELDHVFTRVLCMPKIQNNLLSVSALDNASKCLLQAKSAKLQKKVECY